MTATFKDRFDREWDLTLNLGTVRRVDRSDFSEVSDQKVSLLNFDKELLQVLFLEPGLRTAIIWAIVKNQADAAKVSEEGFLEGFDGATMVSSREALLEALSDFFPEKRTLLLRFREMTKKQEEKMSQLLEKEGDNILQIMDLTMEKEITEAIHKAKESLTSGIPSS